MEDPVLSSGGQETFPPPKYFIITGIVSVAIDQIVAVQTVLCRRQILCLLAKLS